MYMAQPGHIDQIRQVNSGRVYKLIDQYGPISRIDLSKLSGLAPASITKISRELMEAHLIHETVVQESISRGRPATGLQTNHDGWQFLSIRLGKGHLIIALHELGGNVQVETKVNITALNEQQLVDVILVQIETFFQTYADQLERVTSIALTLPGLVDTASGVVLHMPHFNLNNVQLGPAIFERTGLPVFIANDICSWALAEMLFGHAQEVENSLLISNHQGVVAGVVMNGRVLYGRFGNIGELGHIQVDAQGKLCDCGNRGCLDTIASAPAICQQVMQRIKDGEESSLDVADINMETICQAAMQADGLAKSVVETLAKDLAKGIAVMVNIFNPEKIVLGGALNHAKEIIYPIIMQQLTEQTLPIYQQGLKVVESRFYTQTTMPGAALIKQALYDGELLMKVIEG